MSIHFPEIMGINRQYLRQLCTKKDTQRAAPIDWPFSQRTGGKFILCYFDINFQQRRGG